MLLLHCMYLFTYCIHFYIYTLYIFIYVCNNACFKMNLK